MPRLMGFKERHMEVRRCKSDASFVVPHDHQWVLVGVLAVPQEVPLLGDLQILLNDRICYTASLAALAQAFERRNPSELTKILARSLRQRWFLRLFHVAKVVDAAAEAWIKYQRVSTETMNPIVVNSQGLVEFRADTPCEIEFNILKTVPVQ